MNDLVSVLALPAVWSGSEPSSLLETLLDALLGMLDLDFIYGQVKLGSHVTPIEVLRTAQPWEDIRKRGEIRQAFDRWFGESAHRSTARTCITLEDQELSVFPIQLGLEGELGLIFAGSKRVAFPEQTERLILSVAANQAAIGLQQALLLSEQKRVASELDRIVSQRTAELAAANQVLVESEALLKKSQAKLWEVIDTIPVIAWCNLPTGPNEFLNKRWGEFTGLSPEESHGWGWQVAMHPDDLPRLMKRWEELLASGQPDEIEGRFRRHDGVYRWFLIRAEPFSDETGKIIKWYGTSIDIEDRKRAEEELLRNETFLVNAQRVSATGSFSWCIDTDEVTFSEEASRIFGFDPGAPVTFEMIASRVHPDDLELLGERMDAARNGSDGQDYEIRLRMPDCSVKYLHTTSNQTSGIGGRREYIGAIQDVTQQRVAQEALNKARSELAHVSRVTSLSAFTASIAHEINQPLSGIVTNAGTCLRMLNADPPNVEGVRETARRMIRDGNRASDVIRRLRALFGRKEVSAESVDLNEIACEVVTLTLYDLQRNRVILQQELADGLPRVKGDRIQLQQVILNLLHNASDAMSGIEDRPRQMVLGTQLDGDHVRLWVRDAGVGFAPEVADQMFESFYTTKADGMGIGLSVSRSIIEANHGRLWATANEGPGATFAFSIPCDRGPEPR
jgi:PAS domain S-box-containing protein